MSVDVITQQKNIAWICLSKKILIEIVLLRQNIKINRCSMTLLALTDFCLWNTCDLLMCSSNGMREGSASPLSSPMLKRLWIFVIKSSLMSEVLYFWLEPLLCHHYTNSLAKRAVFWKCTAPFHTEWKRTLSLLWKRTGTFWSRSSKRPLGDFNAHFEDATTLPLACTDTVILLMLC